MIGLLGTRNSALTHYEGMNFSFLLSKSTGIRVMMSPSFANILRGDHSSEVSVYVANSSIRFIPESWYM
jgi:hypothetical protein